MAVWVNAFTNGTKSLSSNTNHRILRRLINLYNIRSQFITFYLENINKRHENYEK